MWPSLGKSGKFMIRWAGRGPGPGRRSVMSHREADLSSAGVGRLRLGVIGLGRHWELSQKPALARLRERIEVVAVYDQVARRAEIEAGPLRARAVLGLKALAEGPDVDALAWLAPQWFAAHPVELAVRVGKPLLCAVPLPDDPMELDRLAAILATEPVRGRIFWPAPSLAGLESSADLAAWLDQFAGLARDRDGSSPAWRGSWAAARAAFASTRTNSPGSRPEAVARPEPGPTA